MESNKERENEEVHPFDNLLQQLNFISFQVLELAGKGETRSQLSLDELSKVVGACFHQWNKAITIITANKLFSPENAVSCSIDRMSIEENPARKKVEKLNYMKNVKDTKDIKSCFVCQIQITDDAWIQTKCFHDAHISCFSTVYNDSTSVSCLECNKSPNGL
jgi:hypothetical protein